MELITGLNIIITAYSFQQNLFPTYNSLGANKSNRTGMQAIIIGNGLSFAIYITLGVLSIYTFGRNVDSNIMTNVDNEDNVYSYIIRVAFLIVLACHIPYVFFPTKESLLIMFDEAENHSMQRAIEYKI